MFYICVATRNTIIFRILIYKIHFAKSLKGVFRVCMFTILRTKYDVFDFAGIKLLVAVTIIIIQCYNKLLDNWYCVKIISTVS